jgi:polysaccharide biosynthesis protein PslG
MLCGVLNRPRALRHWLVVASAFLIAGTTTAIAVAREPGAPSAQAAASAKATGAAGRVLDFGVDYSDTLPWETDSELAASLNDAVDLGAKWIRVDLAWEDYQSTSAAFAPDFSRFDRVVDAANARGLHILATIDFPPVWARESACTDTSACPPSDPSEYAQFAATAVAHYAPMGLHDWEIWNEPNNQAWAPQPDPAAYATLLSKTARAIHSADSSSMVILGGLAASRSHPGLPYVAAPDFIREVAADGGLNGVDAVGYHPYPNQDVATSATIESIDSTPDNLVAALSEAGVPTMPIWITETGFSVPEVEKANPNPKTLAKQENAQSQVAAELVHVLSNTPNVAAMFWFSDQNEPSANLFYGLRTAAGVRMPAFNSLRGAIALAEAGKA